jgi:general secretion pathway protein G
VSTPKKTRNRPGLTLIEMLVTLILLAILVAIVFPVVTQQLDDAEPTKAANDLANIKTGLEVFGLNVRPTYPSDLEDLVNPISTADHYLTRAQSNNPYNSGHIDRWNGPYLDKSIPQSVGTSTDDAFVTGFGGIITQNLARYDASTNCEGGGTCGSYSDANQIFVAVRITGLDQTQAQLISEIIDGNTNLTTGQFRRNNSFTGGSDPVDFISYYLAVPLR